MRRNWLFALLTATFLTPHAAGAQDIDRPGRERGPRQIEEVTEVHRVRAPERAEPSRPRPEPSVAVAARAPAEPERRSRAGTETRATIGSPARSGDRARQADGYARPGPGRFGDRDRSSGRSGGWGSEDRADRAPTPVRREARDARDAWRVQPPGTWARPQPRPDVARGERRDRDGRDWSRSAGDWRDASRYDDDWGDRQAWSRAWRNDRRYDWRRHRVADRGAYRLPRYYAPRGYEYGYRRFQVGFALGPTLFGRDYWIDDPYQFRLPEAWGPYRWVRYYNDALLVDIRSGTVVDVEYDIFW